VSVPEFNGQLIRLVAPALEQVRVVVDTIFGEHGGL
jgi:NAD(P)H-nitrite reductase large subunit